MRKKVIILLVLVLGVAVYFMLQTNKPSTNDQAITELQTQVDVLKEQEQKEEVRKLQLQALQDPEIIINEFDKIGTLIVYHGRAYYSDVLRDTTFWGAKEVYLKLKYNFGIGIDFENVEVVQIQNTTVTLHIPKDKLTLVYCELASDKSNVESTTTWFASHFKPDEVEYMFENAWKETKSRIEKTEDIYKIAYDSLKENLTAIIIKLGYTDVVFQEIN